MVTATMVETQAPESNNSENTTKAKDPASEPTFADRPMVDDGPAPEFTLDENTISDQDPAPGSKGMKNTKGREDPAPGLPDGNRPWRDELTMLFRVYMWTRKDLARARVTDTWRKKHTAYGDFERLLNNCEGTCLWLKPLEERKKRALRDLRQCSRRHPHYETVQHMEGAGDVVVGALLACVDIDKADTLGSLYRYCGLAVTPEGKRQRVLAGEIDPETGKRKKGQKRDWNSTLKMVLLADLGGQIVRGTAGERWRAVYDYHKERELAKGLKKGHAHNRAVRRAVKLWLRDLWVQWRTEAGLPASESTPTENTKLKEDPAPVSMSLENTTRKKDPAPGL